MTQDQLLVLLFKIILIADVAAILAFIGQYTALARWWSNAIGRTIVIKDILLVLAFVPSILSLFFHFTRMSSRVAAWFDVALFAGIFAVMCWRIAVWNKIQRARKGPEGDGDEEA